MRELVSKNNVCSVFLIFRLLRRVPLDHAQIDRLKRYGDKNPEDQPIVDEIVAGN